MKNTGTCHDREKLLESSALIHNATTKAALNSEGNPSFFSLKLFPAGYHEGFSFLFPCYLSLVLQNNTL